MSDKIMNGLKYLGCFVLAWIIVTIAVRLFGAALSLVWALLKLGILVAIIWAVAMWLYNKFGKK